MELNNLFKLNQKGFNNVDLNLQSWVADSQSSELNQNTFEMNSNLCVKLFISGFLDSDINSNSNSKGLFLNDFVNVFQNLNDLWHDNDFLYDFFENVWNFNNFFNCAVDWDNSFFVSINDLQLILNLVSNISFQDEVVFLNHFILVDNNFLDFSGEFFNCNNFFFDNWNLNNLLLDDWNLDYFFFDSFNYLVNLDDNWIVDWQLNDLWDLDYFFVVSFDFVNSWDFVGDSHNFFNHFGNLNNLLDS